MNKRELTIVVKGANLRMDGAGRSSQFSQLLRRGDHSQGATNQIFELFGLGRSVDADFPVAAVTRVLDLGVVDNNWWLRADPVHLAAGLSGLTLVANRGLNLTANEAEQIADEVRSQYKEEGWVLKAPNPYRWYLKPKDPAYIVTHALDEVLGKDIEQFLPTGPEEKKWHTLMNEIQILLHTSSSNADREQRGELSVNSLWFWGGGRLPQVSGSEWDKVWSDDVVSLALARISNTEAGKVPMDTTDWLHSLTPGRHLLVVDRQEQGVIEDYMEQVWSEPLARALKAGDVDKLTIYPSSDLCVTLTPSSLRSIWGWLLPFGRA